MAGKNISGVSSPAPRGDSVLRAAGAMGIATFLSRICGLVREQVFAYLFGAGNATDAFNVAFRIPNLLRDLFAEGAMSASFVPVFTRTRVEEGDRRAWRVAGLVFRVLFVTVSLIAILGFIFAPQLVALYAEAFRAVPGKFEMTVRMTRIMFPFFPLVALSAAFMGVLNACGVFFIPSFASALFNVASITFGVVAVFLIRRAGGNAIEGMAFGVLVGGLVQACCQIPALIRSGYRWEPQTPADRRWSEDPALRRMLWMMIPGTMGLAATQVNILVNTILATTQGTGAVSYLSYANRLMLFPIGIFGVSMAQATLPRISKLWVAQDWNGTAETLDKSLKRVFAVNLPASAGLAFLGIPIIQMIFQYGRFDAHATEATAGALAMYSVGLGAYSTVKVLVPAFYAFGNTRIPVISSALAVGLTLGSNLLMIHSLGYLGLALGTSIGATLNALYLFFAAQRILRERGGQLPGGPLLRSFLSYLGVSILMGGLCWISARGLERVIPDPITLAKPLLALVRLAKVSVLMVEGVGFVLLAGRILRLPEIGEAFDLFAKKIKKKLS